MRALLLAAGLGTRLRPITDTIPKCLVVIKGKHLLGIWLDLLTQAGIESCLINTHHFAGQVEEFIGASPHRENVKLVYEATLLGTAGTLIKNLNFFNGEDGMLIHADNYCLADLSLFINAHASRPSDCVMTMMTFRTDNPSSCGIVEVDERGVVIGFYEKVDKPPGNLANCAVYIISSTFLEIMGGELHTAGDFSTEVLHKFLGRIFTYETAETFMDIGTKETYDRANY